MKRKFVGVDLGTHSVKVVAVQTSLRGAQVVEHYVEPIETGPEGGGNLETAAAVAAAILREAGLAAERVCVCVPGSHASYRTLRFPFGDARRIAQALPFELEDQFPVPLDRMHYDYVVSKTADGAGRAWVVGMRRDRIEAVEGILSEAGIEPVALTVGPAALAQALEPGVIALPSEGGGEGGPVEPMTLVVDIGHRTTELVVLGETGPVAARSVRVAGRDVTAAIARAYDMPPAEAERAKRNDGFVLHDGLGEVTEAQARAGGVVRDALLPLVREVRHTIKWLETEQSARVTRVLLSGAASRLREIDAFFAEALGLDVGRVEAAGLSRLRVPDGFDVARELVAVGSAAGAAAGALIDLHLGAEAEADGGVWAPHLRRMGAWAAILAGALALDTVVQVRAAEALLATRRAELAALSEEVFGTSVTSPKEVEDRLEAGEEIDASRLVPERSALDVMATIVDAATPQDKPPPAGAAAAPFDPTGAPATGAPPSTTPPPSAAGASAGGTAKPELAPPPERGIVWADELVLTMVDVRELKVEIAASATRSSAQDRFALELERAGCLKNISKGKVRDQNGRKVFEMNMDNACLLPEGAEGEGS